MLKTYLLTAYRTLIRNKSYSFLNVLGLSLGITCSLLLFLVIKYDLSFDTYHKNADQIYRVNVNENYEAGQLKSSSIHFPAANVLRQNNPGVTNLVQVYGQQDVQVTVPGTNGKAPQHFIVEKPTAFTEPQFFEIFDFNVGTDQKTFGLDEPNNIVLTQSLAHKFFPNSDATGKVIAINNQLHLKVTAVIPDLPANTDFPFGMFISYPTLKQFVTYQLAEWNALSSQQNIYIQAPANADTTAISQNINRILARHLPDKKKDKFKFLLQPLSNLHFNTIYENYSNRTVSKKGIAVMGIIGMFLLITACINFINLATAQATKRAREVGIRKVLGGSKGNLILQFLGETFLITLSAALLSIIFTELSLPFLNKLLGLNLTFSILQDPVLLLFFGLELAIVTIFSGIYPALVLSRFQPIEALKSKLSVQRVAGLSLRRVLVLVQFTICQLLIICTLIVQQQMSFMREKDLGFNKEGVVLIPLSKAKPQKLIAYRQEISRIPGVKEVTFAFSPPSADLSFTTNFTFNHAPEPAPFQASLRLNDEHYLSLFQIKLVAGQPFTHLGNDSTAPVQFLINETMRRKLGLTSPEKAVGKKILLGKSVEGTILGVTEDFHQNNLRQTIEPMVMMNTGDSPSNILFMAAKIDLSQTKSVVKQLEKVWMKAYPEHIFDYLFLDQLITEFYKEEEVRNTLFKVFSCISIFIGCLGLYGLVAFMIAQRTKEIGVRKVLGASLFDIAYLFSKEFIRLVLIAFVIAAPIAWYLMNKWLQDYEYRITLNPTAFIIAGFTTLAISLLTMSTLTIRAARKNPVLALKTE